MACQPPPLSPSYLRSPQRHHRQQHSPPALYNRPHHVAKALLPLLPRRVRLDPVRRLHDDDMGRRVGQLGAGQVPVGASGVVPGVQHADTADLDEEHGGTQDVPGGEGGNADAIQVQLKNGAREASKEAWHGMALVSIAWRGQSKQASKLSNTHLLVKVDDLYPLHGRLQVLFVEERRRLGVFGELDKVAQQRLVHRLGGVRHENATLERRVAHDVRNLGNRDRDRNQKKKTYIERARIAVCLRLALARNHQGHD